MDDLKYEELRQAGRLVSPSMRTEPDEYQRRMHTCERCGHSSVYVLRSRADGKWLCQNLDACKRRAAHKAA